MTAGAVAALLFGAITPEDAVKAIHLEVMLFLFGMFVIGEAVCMSGVLTRVSSTICRFAHTPDQLLCILIPVMGLSSALLMNDTIAIIGTPLVLSLAMRYRISPQALLLTLCFSLTTGSVLSPIGNPQNLLLVTYWNPPDPFLPFISALWVPTAISLVLVFVIMRIRCTEGVVGSWTPRSDILVSDDTRLHVATHLSLLVLGGMILLRVVSPFFGDVFSLSLGWMALSSALPVLLLARQRLYILKGVDWKTLLFFVAMFVLMQSVYDSGCFQSVMDLSFLSSIPMIILLSVVISQFISNVPFIALFEPAITSAGLSPAAMLALAAGSTIAGNLTIIGAASNVIVIQKAEQSGISVSFIEFFRVGLPLTILQGMVYIGWLTFIQ